MITKPPQVIERHAQASQAVFGGNSHLACKGRRSEPPGAHVDHVALSEVPWWLAPLRCGQGLCPGVWVVSLVLSPLPPASFHDRN